MNSDKKLLRDNFLNLKLSAGSHSPSVITLKEKLPNIPIKVDACFLSNPYATELFLDYLNEDLKSKINLREILEFYPSTNQVISSQLSKVLDVGKENVFICNGAIEAIQAVIHNFTKQKLIVNIPTFSSYYEFARPDTEVVFYKMKKDKYFKLDIDDYIDFVRRNNPDTVVIINPNNPDGGYIEYEMMKYVITELKDVDNLIIDESFIHFAFEDKSLSPVSNSKLFNDFNNLIIIKSMSKDFGIAGIRAGYVIMNEEKIKKLLENGYLWNSNGFSEYFFRLYSSKAFLNDYENIRRKYILETSGFFQELSNKKGIKLYPSKANFALIELINNQTSDDFVADLLIDSGIYVRTCSDKIGLDGEFVRIASRTFNENQLIINSLK